MNLTIFYSNCCPKCSGNDKELDAYDGPEWDAESETPMRKLRLRVRDRATLGSERLRPDDAQDFSS